MEIKEIKEQIFNKIKEYENIIIVRHVKPDGDCMGSSFGLREILRESFPEKNIYSIGKMKSDYLAFLGTEDADVSEEIYQNALIIAVDTGTKDRIDNELFGKGKELIKIDHHINVEEYGNINYVREDFPATCAIIIDFYVTYKDQLILNDKAAKCLFVGLVTDTGRFKYSGVSGDVLRLGAEVLDKNLNIEEIYSNLYLKEKEELKLQGYILNKFKTTPNGVSYFFVSQNVQKKFKVSTEDASAMINILDSIRQNLIWIFFIEQKNKTIRVRIRSRFIPINQLAEKYHGGGHKQASGATVYNKKEFKQLLYEADKLLADFKNNNPEVF